MFAQSLVVFVLDYLKDIRAVEEVIEPTNTLRRRAVVKLAREYASDFDLAIKRFNQLNGYYDIDLLAIMPKAEKLKSKLQGRQLPTLTEMLNEPGFYSHAFVRGAVHAHKMMLNAQNDAPVGDALKIKSIMLQTSWQALVLAILGHLMEQTLFQVLSDIPNWQKDDILVPLDDVFMLLVAEGELPAIQQTFTILTSYAADGGIGWINSKRWAMFYDDYASLVGNSATTKGAFEYMLTKPVLVYAHKPMVFTHSQLGEVVIKVITDTSGIFLQCGAENMIQPFTYAAVTSQGYVVGRVVEFNEGSSGVWICACDVQLPAVDTAISQ